ncbi:allantoinase AllB [Solirubrobacter ginsenosidimutans]|uniref:Allantoinase n=1 Tax=Solirubrobacter ginsenosidimutans TaxID=490573 RepID=A0A9X3MW07_9ACTN|nr:allantoinase AllB [Solirubrobacter ginsenosidimutans]MDA0163452.1 allantoinase AllB [Solirubrobacter ginsenosidimutans]
MFDLIVRGGTVVTPSGVTTADVGVLDGAIAAVERELAGGAREELDAAGLHVFPGGLDPHVHFNEPGRTHWEGLQTGTAALAAGGFTAFFDMPLNSSPPVIDGAAFDAKLQAARASARVDYGFWGGLVPGNVEHLADLAERGAVGFKAFMSNSGIDEFARADDVTLYEGMAECARLGKLVAVHAENEALTARPSGSSARAFMASRPIVAEVEAIGRAIAFAEDTGCALHIVHVSSARGVALVAEARTRGVDVTCETCPHYLWLSQDDVETLGAVAKCAPPVRPDAERSKLWQLVKSGAVDMLTSDHSPSSPELKAGDFAGAWGGIAGCQTTLTLLLSERDGLALEQVARLVSGGAARRFGMPRKGRIEVGADADLALVDLGAKFRLSADDLQYRHKLSPWLGRRLRARVTRTLLRGAEAWPEPKAAPRLLTPSL